MKKAFTFALCIAALAASASAQKQAVNDAKKLSGKEDKLVEARALIKGAMENPETQNDPQTYIVAGDIEYDVFDKIRTIQMINPNDPNIDPVALGEMLLNGYNYYLQAFPLDSLPNEKGQVKPKYSKDAVKAIAGHANDFFTFGAEFFNAKKYYPEAYQAFMIYGDMPDMPQLGKSAPQIDDATRATSYFNAGLGAYSGNALREAAKAFNNAQKLGYGKADEVAGTPADPTAYIYELACWQNLAQKDSTIQDEAQRHIYEIATNGNREYGVAQPVFLNNLVNCMVNDNKNQEALDLINKEISANPGMANLYSLRAFVNTRLEKLNEAEADYRKAAETPNADFETLKNASKMIFRLGTQKWNEIEGTSPEASAARKNVKENYWEWAKSVAEKAAQTNPNDGELNDIIDSIEYNLSSYTF